MSHTYWKQWSGAELADMQGVLPDDHKDYLDDREPEIESELLELQEEAISMQSLGLTWRDFV